jgi:hypothetical protein
MTAAALGWNMWKFTPNLCVVFSRNCAIAASSSAVDMVAAARKPKPPAFEVAATSFASATQPIAVCTIG